MTEQQKLEITVGMRVMVKVAAREIPATVVEVGGDWFLVRSDGTGREFKTRRVVDILDRPETDEAGIAEAAAEVAAEEDATAELRRVEEEGGDADVAVETAEAVEDEKPADADGEGDAKTEEQPETEASAAEEGKAEEPKVEESKAEEQSKDEEDKAEDAKTEEAKADEDKAEKDKAGGEAAKAEEPPKAEDTVEEGEAPASDGGDAQEATADAKSRKNLSLVDAAIEVLKAEKRPMGAKELVRLAVERGLWIPTKAKTPDQSLYGGLYLEMKNSKSPRVRKSAEKGRFELIG